MLHDINLYVPAGSTLAIVGPTGSGKSTLAALIARLWEAPEDTLLIDGRSIRDWPLAELRRSIGFVPQDTYLFSETVRENIAFGVDDASDDAVNDAAETASIAAEIAEFPAGYRNHGRRARHHPFRRTEAAHRARARRPAQSENPDPGRCPLQPWIPTPKSASSAASRSS